jgi:FAD dependent oxidoreductase TIGR03364
VALKIIVIGGGIIGLTHAVTAREAGHDVTLFERDGRALGASVRNFGTIWPIGCAFGPEREQALFGVKRWKEIAAPAGIWKSAQGALSLAYRDEAWSVLQEFCGAQEGFELLKPEEVARRYPAARKQGLRGALFSGDELLIHAPTAIPALADYARNLGVTIHMGTPVAGVHADRVDTADGRTFSFDQLVVAAGEEMRVFFPEELSVAQVHPCRLQMMRTVCQPAGFELGAILVSDLTLCHYPAFRNCPSIGKLRERLTAELPEHNRWGVHVIAAQHQDGTITIGDSHEYGLDLPPESMTLVDELILGALNDFVHIPHMRIALRWQGTYLKSKTGQTQVVLHPRERVTMVTAMGGLGMTLSWGLARRIVQSWNS